LIDGLFLLDVAQNNDSNKTRAVEQVLCCNAEWNWKCVLYIKKVQIFWYLVKG